MNLPKINIVLISLFVFSSMQSIAMDLDLSLDFDEKSALTELTDGDYKKLREMAVEALNNNPDGSSEQWVNNETGNRGMITILSTQDKGTELCRNTEFVNTARGVTSNTLLTICKPENGEWKGVEDSFNTSSEVNDVPLVESTNQSIVFEENLPESTEISRKTLDGKGNPDYCLELSETLGTLMINPQLHTDTVTEYKKNCL